MDELSREGAVSSPLRRRGEGDEEVELKGEEVEGKRDEGEGDEEEEYGEE